MSNYLERRGVWEHPVTKVSRCIWGWMFIGSFSVRVASVTGVSLSGKEEANINGDLRSESQKTQAERIIPQTEN